jgi:hypothetical protein
MALETAYRTAFRDYADKLEILQNLIESGPVEAAQIESVLLEVEKARVAHNCARDRLAAVLGEEALGQDALGGNGRLSTPTPPSGEGHIRETARLMWELAGRPNGTAEHDWCTAEQLVKSVVPPPC